MCTMRCKTISSAFYKIQRLTIVAAVLFLSLMSIVAVSQFVSQDNARSNNRHLINTAVYGQLTTQDREGMDSATETMNTTTTISNSNSNNFQSASSFLIRGLIGSITVRSTAPSSDQGNQTNQEEGAQSYVVAGRWRMVVNQSLLERFVANLTIAAIDGRGPSYNIIVEDVGGSFNLQRIDNALISEITANIYAINNKSANIIAPVQVEVRGNNIVQIVPLGIDERMLGAEEETQESQLQILRSIDRHAIYGIIQTTEITG
jgi:hypothetical protein